MASHSACGAETLHEPGLLGVADRQLQRRAIKVDVAADAFSSPPRMRALDAKAVELGDERRRAFETVSGHARILAWHSPCYQQPRRGRKNIDAHLIQGGGANVKAHVRAALCGI